MIDVCEAVVRFHELRQMSLSPAHYKAAVEMGRSVQPDTKSKRFGSIVDAILFGTQPYSVWDGTRRGKAWDEFEAANSSRLIVTRDEFNRADCCAQSVAHNRDAMRVLEGERQRSIPFEWLGRKCSTTPDIIKPGSHVSDFKTAASAHPDRFRFAALRYSYHAQHRNFGIAAEFAKLDVGEHFIVVAESSPPWAVTVLRLTPRALLAGEKMLRVWMERLNVCIETNEWPAYAQTVLDLDVDEESELIFDGDEPSEEAAQ